MSHAPGLAARQPLLRVPAIILVLIAAMALIHGWRTTLTDEADFAVLARYAFEPARMTLQVNPDMVMDELRKIAKQGPQGLQEVQQIQFLLGHGEFRTWTFVTYSFLHADISHIGLNCLWLLAFGSAVARRFGPWRFALFFAVTVAAGALAHWAVYPTGFAPVIGASASVSGAMAAAARFMFQPRSKVAGDELPALPLRRLLADRRVLLFLGIWLVVNVFTGLAAVPLGLSDSGIAWEAHTGGFLAGLVMFDWFDPVKVAMRAPARQI